MQSSCILRNTSKNSTTQHATRNLVPQVIARSSTGAECSWSIGSYYTKKLERNTDSLGNFIEDPSTTAESAFWTSDAKLRLAADTLSSSLSVPSDTLLHNVQQLGSLVPGGHETLSKLKVADRIRLAAVLDRVPQRLIALRDALPPAVSLQQVVSGWPYAIFLSADDVHHGIQRILEEFSGVVDDWGVYAIIQTTPQILDENIFKTVLRGAGHLMPPAQLANSLARYPDYWMQFQTLEYEPRNDYDELLKDVNYYMTGAALGNDESIS